MKLFSTVTLGLQTLLLTPEMGPAQFAHAAAPGNKALFKQCSTASQCRDPPAGVAPAGSVSVCATLDGSQDVCFLEQDTPGGRFLNAGIRNMKVRCQYAENQDPNEMVCQFSLGQMTAAQLPEEFAPRAAQSPRNFQRCEVGVDQVDPCPTGFECRRADEAGSGPAIPDPLCYLRSIVERQNGATHLYKIRCMTTSDVLRPENTLCLPGPDLGFSGQTLGSGIPRRALGQPCTDYQQCQNFLDGKIGVCAGLYVDYDRETFEPIYSPSVCKTFTYKANIPETDVFCTEHIQCTSNHCSDVSGGSGGRCLDSGDGNAGGDQNQCTKSDPLNPEQSVPLSYAMLSDSEWTHGQYIGEATGNADLLAVRDWYVGYIRARKVENTADSDVLITTLAPDWIQVDINGVPTWVQGDPLSATISKAAFEADQVTPAGSTVPIPSFRFTQFDCRRDWVGPLAWVDCLGNNRCDN